MKAVMSICLLSLMFLAGCSSESTQKSTSVKHRTLFNDVYKQVEKPGQYIFRSLEETKALGLEPLPEEIQNFDFETEMLVAVALGMKPSGGYGVKIKEIKENAEEWTVSYEEFKPKEGMNVTMALTFPTHVIATKKSDKAVVFKKIEVQK